MKNLIKAAALLLFAACAPLSHPPLPSEEMMLGEMLGQCEDGSIMNITLFAVDDEGNKVAYFHREDKPVATVDFKNQKVYIYASRKFLTLDEAKAKYPTPCDIPVGVST